MPAHMKRRRNPLPLLGLLLMTLLTIGLALVAMFSAGTTTNRTAARDMLGNAVTVDPGGEVAPESSVTADTHARFRVPSVHLDVPLGVISPTHGQITPPGFTSAYEIRTIGTTPDKPENGTVFVVMHALRNGGIAPGNYVTDVHAARSRLAPGTEVVVAGTTYEVTGSRNVRKRDLPADTTTWTNTPNRLVIITCLEHADGSPSTHNTVITATRA